jgi:hypothetical protein
MSSGLSYPGDFTFSRFGAFGLTYPRPIGSSWRWADITFIGTGFGGNGPFLSNTANTCSPSVQNLVPTSPADSSDDDSARPGYRSHLRPES